MIEIMSFEEGRPDTYPAKPSGLSSAADAYPAAFIWHMLERRIAWRWASRSAEVILEGGPGPFELPLRPAEITLTEAWNGESWEAVTLATAPRGGVYLSSRAPYRITFTAGDTETPPDIMLEAYRRLAEYLGEVENEPVPAGAYSHSIDLGGVKESTRFDPWRRARALDMSGAGDLLRIYRKA
ncbi:hypothetical protein L2D01_06540 [Hyphomonadaceae bacterium ML37]|nr:hypothetical protein L2D01_06540 [Hyphomonadaceae bacterium ML37]